MSTVRQPRGVPAGGQFAPNTRAEPVLTLDPAVADHTDIDRYFDGGVDDIVLAPWVADGIFPSYYEGYWRDLPVEDIDPRGLRRTQKRLLRKHLERAARNAEPDGGDAPWIIRYKGASYVVDGHHRIAHAVHNERPRVPVHIVDLGQHDRSDEHAEPSLALAPAEKRHQEFLTESARPLTILDTKGLQRE